MTKSTSALLVTRKAKGGRREGIDCRFGGRYWSVTARSHQSAGSLSGHGIFGYSRIRRRVRYVQGEVAAAGREMITEFDLHNAMVAAKVPVMLVHFAALNKSA